MRLIVTRPDEDGAQTAADLAQRGHETIAAPLLDIVTTDGPPLDLSGVQAILATSANGVRALVHRTTRRDITLFAVGPQSAEAARQAGFSDVRSANGDVQALIAMVQAQLTPQGGALLHAAGRHTRGALAHELSVHGFSCRGMTLYEAVAAPRLPEAAAEALRRGCADGVLFYSPRSAQIFAALVARQGLAAACAPLTAYCISTATAEALGGLSFARVAIAATPDRAGMLTLVDGAACSPPSSRL